MPDWRNGGVFSRRIGDLAGKCEQRREFSARAWCEAALLSAAFRLLQVLIWIRTAFDQSRRVDEHWNRKSTCDK
jgi:hypothetical protein